MLLLIKYHCSSLKVFHFCSRCDFKKWPRAKYQFYISDALPFPEMELRTNWAEKGEIFASSGWKLPSIFSLSFSSFFMSLWRKSHQSPSLLFFVRLWNVNKFSSWILFVFVLICYWWWDWVGWCIWGTTFLFLNILFSRFLRFVWKNNHRIYMVFRVMTMTTKIDFSAGFLFLQWPR